MVKKFGAFFIPAVYKLFGFEDTGCARKSGPACSCQNFIKSPPNLIIFGTQIDKMIEICEVYSLSISPNLCQYTTVLKTDAVNCCIMLSCCHRKSSNDFVKHTIN